MAKLLTANPDLSAQEQLTSGDASNGWPTWSPDGARLAFDSDRADPDREDDVPRSDIVTMAPDGGSLRQNVHRGPEDDGAGRQQPRVRLARRRGRAPGRLGPRPPALKHESRTYRPPDKEIS